MKTDTFSRVVSEVARIGYEKHFSTIIENSISNKKHIEKSIRDIDISYKNRDSALVISAGPSLHKNNILERIKNSDYKGIIVAVDGSYIKCLQNGVVPDFVLTLDPHPTRMVRWFGDPDFEKNMEGDDFFDRQDLNIEFRNNSQQKNRSNINLVDEHASESKLVICSTAPKNIVSRCLSADFDSYWWAPLVDNPYREGSVTRTVCEATGLPAMNTGGNVGSAAWVFAQTQLKAKNIAVVGMDLGYYSDTPIEKTQTYYELKSHLNDDDFKNAFRQFKSPISGEDFYVDPTYAWYCQNLLDMIKANGAKLYNCSGGGVLFGDGVECISIEDFISKEVR